jgi:hypothetical protein
MPQIPVSTTLGFIGFLLILVGGFLLLAGLGIVGVEKITVQKGKPTWILGTVFAIIGIVLIVFSEPFTKNATLTAPTNTPITPAAIELPAQTLNATESLTAATTPESPIKTETVQPSSIDVPDPLGSDVLEFANSIQFNMEPKGLLSKIDGLWNSEWCCREGNVWVSGTATILVSDGYWVHIIQEDNGGGQYVIKAKFMDNRLVGRYINVNVKSDTHPWVGILVDDNRIDGMWKYGAGKEWNFFRNP